LRCNASGLILGTPTQSGTFLVLLEAKNYWGTASATISIAIGRVASPPPALTILRNGDELLLTWSSASDGFVLEETRVQPVAWTNSAAAIVRQGNDNVAAIATAGTAKFYRLRK